MLYVSEISSPVGPLTLISDGEHLCGLCMESQKFLLASMPEDYVTQQDVPLFRDVEDWLNHYFAGEPLSPLTLPLAPPGTPYRRKVWRRIADIPYGTTITYGELAEELDSTPRAIGRAVGDNPIAIIVPCHRVIGTGGSLVGYAGGLENKKLLLKLESEHMQKKEAQEGQ